MRYWLLVWLLLSWQWVQAQFGEPIRQIKTQQKVVALTFDDGPEAPYTQKILDVLAKYNVKATFYVLGGNAKAAPDLIKATMAQGHDLGSHSMYHTMMKNRSVEKITADLQQVDAILRQIGYKGEITFRAPYGVTSPNLKTALINLHKRMVLFTFLAQDWTPISAEQIYANVMKQLKPGLIITLHDGGKRRDNTVKAVEMLIKTLKAQGYEFLTISQMLKLEN